MGAQIEQHLRRHRADLADRFQFESNQSIMNMVAEGKGWAITTPTNFIRAGRFHSQITMMPFPGKNFARYLSVFTTEQHDSRLARTVADIMRQLVQNHAIDPMVERHPWLTGVFALLPAGEGAQGRELP